MAIGKYQKIGLRRDKNLLDISNKGVALENILNNLAKDNETFIPDDIKVLDNVRNTNVTRSDFESLKGLSSSYVDPTDNNSIKLLTPSITIQDKVENFKVTTGSPPYLTGGDGMLAKFIPSSQISPDIDGSFTGSTVFDNSLYYGPIIFWDDGIFEFGNNIYPKFTDAYGMIQWEGYFAPSIDDVNVRITYETSGLLLIEQDPTNTGTWETLKSIYAEDRTVTVQSSTVQTTDTIRVDTTFVKHLSINDRIKGASAYITGININTGAVTLSETITLPARDTEMTFTFDLGTTTGDTAVELNNSYTNNKIHTRITVWWPKPSNNNRSYAEKKITMRYYTDDGSRNFLSFNFLYSAFEPNVTLPPLTLEYFAKNYFTPVRYKTEKAQQINKVFTSKYDPPKATIDRIQNLLVSTYTYKGMGKIETTDAFADVEVGDYFLRRTGTPRTYQIIEKVYDSRVFVDHTADIAAANTTFNAHILKFSGLVGVYLVNNGVITELAGSDFKRHMIQPNQLISTISTTTTAVTGFFRIATFNSATGAITYDDFQEPKQTVQNGIAVIYRSSSLEDLSKTVFCAGVLGKELDGVVDQNSLTLTLTNVDGLSPGMAVQLAGYIPSTATIQSINGKIVTLSSAVTSPIKTGITVTFAPAGSANKEICVIPLNTAPPFVGTDTGLTTQQGNEELSVNKLTYNSLIMTTPTTNIRTIGATDLTYAKGLRFSADGVNYKFLIK